MKKLKGKRIKYVGRLAALLVIVIFPLSVCRDGDEAYSYREEAPAVESKARVSTTEKDAGARRFDWDTPAGWQEKRTESGFRLATFTISSGKDKALCTVVPLKGDGGGLKANVGRWMGQLEIKIESEADFNSFLSRQERFSTVGGLKGVLADFTPLTPRSGDRSILAGVISLEDVTVFIKMTGTKALLSENREKFEALCRSFKSE